MSLPTLLCRSALDDCQLHLDNLRSRASALAGGVAPLSAITVAASLLDSAALAAAAARSAARAVGSDQRSAHTSPNPLEALDIVEPCSRQPWSKRPAGKGMVGQPGSSEFHPWPISRSSPWRSSVAETGITVRDLEEGIAGLARPSPSTPALGFDRMDPAVTVHSTPARTRQSESGSVDLFGGRGGTRPGNDDDGAGGGHGRGLSRVGSGMRASDSKMAGTPQQGPEDGRRPELDRSSRRAA